MKIPLLAFFSAVAVVGLACGSSSSTPGTTPQPIGNCVGASCDDAQASEASTGEDGGAGDGATEPDATVSPWVPPVLPKTSAGCGIPHGKLTNAVHTTPSGRTFHVWGPANYDASTNYPVALTYHGWYTNGPDFQSWFYMDRFVGNDGLTVYPDSKGGQWDQFGSSDLLFFDEMMKVLADNYCIDPSRVLGFGFSNGGIFMSHLGCNRAGYVKAISVGDGSKGGDGLGCGRLPVLITHRTADPEEKIAWAYENRDRWAGLNGCSAQSDMTDTTFNCTTQRGCKSPGSLTFCEDTYFDASWQPEWNHTVQEHYRQFTWDWFKALP